MKTEPEPLYEWAGMLWVACKLRKSCRCHATGKVMKSGRSAYRPLTNSMRRMWRMGEMPKEARNWNAHPEVI